MEPREHQPPASQSPLERFKTSVRPKKAYSPLPQRQKAGSTPKKTRRQARLKDLRAKLQPIQQGARRAGRSWWLEILAGIAVALTFSGLVAALHSYQNHPLPEWPLGFSFNTALSVFGVVFKVPLLFIAAEGISQLKWHWFSSRRPLSELSIYDAASRGPLGSVRLLWTARWRNITAFLGSLITVVAIGVDPFTQAIVSYHDCRVETNGSTSSIGRLNSFFTQGTGYSMPPSVRVAIDSSLADATTILPNYTCSTDACTLDTYHSIGMCSRCTEVTDQIHTSCVAGQAGTGYGKGCNYTLSEPFPTFDANTTASFISGPVLSRDDSRDFEYANWQVFAVQKYHNTIGDSGVMLEAGAKGTTDHVAATIDLVSALPILGCRCFLYYCVRTYTATIDSGILQETLQSTSSNWSTYAAETPVLGTVRVDCLTSAVQSRLLSDGCISSVTKWMAWNGTYLKGTESQEHISDSSNLAIPVGCVYQAQLLDDILGPSSIEHFSDSLSGTLIGSGSNTTIQTDPASSSILLGLWNNGSISMDSINGAFANFSAVVSNYLRTLDNVAIPRNITHLLPSYVNEPVPLNPVPGVQADWNQPVLGEAFTNKTCIHVRWPWLALPAALMTGILVFLVALISQTARDGGHEVWKSSQDALLWHGLDGPAQHEGASLVTNKDMHERAKELMVRLAKTGKGWKLVQDDERDGTEL
ncbi:hypothetical protein H2200_010343 [Cladophialophora chaetospira]|uniref:Uncharacterized protein n=1 Tax=Cladophialophora chaetospira TaxID=386627 RepID=A0AA39CE70_9EURO|nr:hypothetical protein H2200_010343 [Cladophialophora chaetospira]